MDTLVALCIFLNNIINIVSPLFEASSKLSEKCQLHSNRSSVRFNVRAPWALKFDRFSDVFIHVITPPMI